MNIEANPVVLLVPRPELSGLGWREERAGWTLISQWGNWGFFCPRTGVEGAHTGTGALILVWKGLVLGQVPPHRSHADPSAPALDFPAPAHARALPPPRPRACVCAPWPRPLRFSPPRPPASLWRMRRCAHAPQPHPKGRGRGHRPPRRCGTCALEARCARAGRFVTVVGRCPVNPARLPPR